MIPWLTGGGDGFKIMIRERSLTRIEIELTALGLIDDGIEMRARSLAAGLSLLRKGGEIEIGDIRFDSNVMLRGRQSLLVALFDAETRRRAVSFAVSGGRVKDGRLKCTVRHSDNDSLLQEAVSGMIDLARRLHTPVSYASALADNLLNDPCLPVRLRSLSLLAFHYPDDEETVKALRAALSDDSPELRLRAAIAIGTDGDATLKDLAESLDVPDRFRVEALNRLGLRLEIERAAALLEASVRWKRRPAVAVAAVEVLGLHGQLAQPWLLPVLECRISSVVCAAAGVLEAHGSIAAIPFLRDAIDFEPFNLTTRRAASRAIAAIKARATNAEPGQLTIAETGPEAGQLSLSTAEHGQLSLVP
jgi:hypothetical protein